MDYQGTLCACGKTREHNHPQCRECHTAYEKNRRNSSPEKQEAARQACRDSRDKLRDEMFAAYGQRCACPGGCDIMDKAFLTLDHVKGGGRKHARDLGVNAAGVNIYRALRKQGWPKDGYRILCMNCNWAIRNGGKCPHEN